MWWLDEFKTHTFAFLETSQISMQKVKKIEDFSVALGTI